jgi:antitoxin component of MazEF toxin-antitoxin module
MFDPMIKTITKIGNSQGIMLDAALMDLAHLKVGDQVNLTVHDGGAIYLAPIRSQPGPAEMTAAIRKTVRDYRKTLSRLA